MQTPIIILAECFEQLIASEAAAVNDAAFRKQFRALAKTPGVLNALAKARDAPPPAPKKRAPKPHE